MTNRFILLCFMAAINIAQAQDNCFYSLYELDIQNRPESIITSPDPIGYGQDNQQLYLSMGYDVMDDPYIAIYLEYAIDDDCTGKKSYAEFILTTGQTIRRDHVHGKHCNEKAAFILQPFLITDTDQELLEAMQIHGIVQINLYFQKKRISVMVSDQNVIKRHLDCLAGA